MALSTGSTLGAYEIVSLLGSGGMGEVYRARDTKLGRAVAIKVLPEAFAFDPDRVARFEREAKVLASLNHPHVSLHFTMAEGMLGLSGFTTSFCVAGLMTRSRSSIGTAPSSVWSPRTSAPVKVNRPSKRTSIGPT